LLHDYLATDGNPLYSAANSGTEVTNVFQKNQRDKSKVFHECISNSAADASQRVFKLGELDKKNPQMASEQEEIDKILESSVPGLVSKSQRRSITNKGDRSVSYETPTVGHKLLVKPTVFNISLLLPPSLSFLTRLKDIVPPNSEIAVSTLTSFLDDFLVNVFNPQLDETVTEMCTQSFMELDGFQQDTHWADHGRRPIFKVYSLDTPD
jgi:exocyst complex component 4